MNLYTFHLHFQAGDLCTRLHSNNIFLCSDEDKKNIEDRKMRLATKKLETLLKSSSCFRKKQTKTKSRKKKKNSSKKNKQREINRTRNKRRRNKRRRKNKTKLKKMRKIKKQILK